MQNFDILFLKISWKKRKIDYSNKSLERLEFKLCPKYMKKVQGE